MDILNLSTSQTAQLNQTPPPARKTTSADDVAGQAITGSDTKQSGIADGDRLSLSTDGLKLARTANGENHANPTPIANPQQAKNAVSQTVSDVLNFPSQALAAYGNVTAAGVKALLT